MRFLLLVSIVCCFFKGKATGDMNFVSPRHYGLGGNSVTLIGGFTSLENVGTLAMVDSISIHLAVKNNYLISDLTTYGTGILYPLNFGALGVSITRFGNKYYNQNKISLIYGKQLSDNFCLGIKINYHRLQQFEYGNKGLMTTEIGFLAKLSNDLSLGAHFYNPFGTKVHTVDDTFRLQSGVRIGVEYKLENVLLLTEIEGNTVDHFLLKTGVEYSVSESMFFRVGYAFPTNQISTGLGVKGVRFTADVYFQYHTRLGGSSGISFGYVFP